MHVVDAVSKLSIPLMLSIFPLYAILRGVKVYEEFVDGAKEGFDVAVRIIPTSWRFWWRSGCFARRAASTC